MQYCSRARKGFLTGDERESLHGRKRIVPGSIEDVEAIDFASDLVHLPVEIFNRRRVAVVEAVVQKSRYDRRLSHSCGSEQNQPETVLRRDVGLLDQHDRHRPYPTSCCPSSAIQSRGYHRGQARRPAAASRLPRALFAGGGGGFVNPPEFVVGRAFNHDRWRPNGNHSQSLNQQKRRRRRRLRPLEFCRRRRCRRRKRMRQAGTPAAEPTVHHPLPDQRSFRSPPASVRAQHASALTHSQGALY